MQYKVMKRFYPEFPEALVFSRWNSYCYDTEPKWVWFAGSQVDVRRLGKYLDGNKRMRSDWIEGRMELK
jgi:hypothetical protein